MEESEIIANFASTGIGRIREYKYEMNATKFDKKVLYLYVFR